jgi:autophagy-related protein 27
MHGAKFPPTKNGIKQQVVIDFLCDRKQQNRRGESSGNTTKDEDGEEGNGEDEDEDDPNAADGQETEDGEGGKLKYLSYNDVQGTQVLSLEWTTKYACEDPNTEGRSHSSGHWGFFTWLVIM